MAQVEFAILGAGAIGSILGAHLARAGHRVAMLARGRRAQQLQADGLRITGLVECVVPVQVITQPSELTAADVFIVAMKTPGTAEALAPLRSAQIGAAFSIQNGLWKNEQLALAFGAERVLGSLANTSGELRADGEVLFTRNVNLLIGELDGRLSDRATRIAAAIDAAGVRSTAMPDMLAHEWTKFVGWAGMMMMSVTTRAVTWRFMTDPDCAIVLVRLIREVHALAQASNVRLMEQPGAMSLSRVIEGSDSDAVAEIVRSGEEFKRMAPDHRVSALQDLLAGRGLEIHETVGDAVRKAQELGVATPLLDGLYHVVAAIDRMR